MATFKKLQISAFLIAFCLLSQVKAAILAQPSSFDCCNNNVVSVSGQAKVSVEPDIATLNVGVTFTSQTSQGALQIVATKINQITQILLSNKIQKDDISTHSISISPQYDYPDGKLQIAGQQAQQTLSVTVRGIDKNGGNIGPIIDQLAKVDGVQFNGLSFDKEDRSSARKQARKIAFEDAKNKAQDFAALADRNLGRALTIIDESLDSGKNFASADSFISAKVVSTSVPVGAIDVSYTVNVKFELR